MRRTYILLCTLIALSLLRLLSRGPRSLMLDPEESLHVVEKNATEIINPDSQSTTLSMLESELPPPSSSMDNKTSESDASTTTEETPNPEPTSTTTRVDEPIVTSEATKSYSESDVNNGDKSSEAYEAFSSESEKITETPPSTTTAIEDITQQKEEMQNIDKGKNSSYKESENETDSHGITPTSSLASSTPPPESNDSYEKMTKNSTTTTYTSNQLLKPRSDSDLSPIARKFVEAHCDLTHLKDKSWYPFGPEDEWQQRAPYLIVAGVWNAGVNPLANALLKHPQIVAAKQNGFFLPKQFFRYYDIQSSDSNMNIKNQTAAASTGSNFNVKVFAARERMYAQVYRKAMLLEKRGSNDEESTTTTVKINNNENHDSKNEHVAIDVSPGLIFYAHKTAHSILCTAPWVKIVVLLRNPIDRLYHQWSYSVTHLKLKLSLEDWMAQEMKLLQSVGMIGGGEEADKERPTAEAKLVVSEKEAWEKYQSVRNVAGAIGRSLYVLQLEEWIQAYISAGKNPSEEIIILTTENIEEDPEREYAGLVRFLGLAPLNDISNSDGEIDSVTAGLGNALYEKTDTTPMTEETRNMLRQFFKPYNKRLTELLTSNGFKGDWDKRWE